MTRGRRILAYVGLGVVGLLLLLVITTVIVVQTDWFRNFVRNKIIAVTEESTGGHVEIGRFNFEWTGMRATIDNFVLHGKERADEAPLFRADRLMVELNCCRA